MPSWLPPAPAGGGGGGPEGGTRTPNRSWTLLGSMLGVPTYQLRDLGQVASSLCLNLFTREMQLQLPLTGRG